MSARADAGHLLAKLRAEAPLVHCITNYVAMNVAANVVLAAGASPAMVHAVEEAEEFAAIAGALTVNIGTLSPPWVEGMKRAIAGAQAAGKPWVLDPVAHFATAYRRGIVSELMALGPTIVRGNASEILALAGEAGGGRGVDATDSVGAAREAATRLARRQDCVIAVSGAEDFVTDGSRAVSITGGSSLMPKVTALGCAQTCLVGAFVAIAAEDAFAATVAGFAAFAVAGRDAEVRSKGPGSFALHFLDALAALPAERLEAVVGPAT